MFISISLAKKLLFFFVIFAFYADSLRSFVIFFSNMASFLTRERCHDLMCRCHFHCCSQAASFLHPGVEEWKFCHSKACLLDIWVRKAFDECFMSFMNVHIFQFLVDDSLKRQFCDVSWEITYKLLVDHDREVCKYFLIELNFLAIFWKSSEEFFLIKLDNFPHFFSPLIPTKVTMLHFANAITTFFYSKLREEIHIKMRQKKFFTHWKSSLRLSDWKSLRSASKKSAQSTWINVNCGFNIKISSFLSFRMKTTLSMC